MQRKIAVLRYELEHPATVSPDEMIEVLSFARGDGEGRISGHISNKTLYIAMNYQTEAARLSGETMDEIMRTLLPLERELHRLEHHLALLPEREQTIIRLHYFEGATWDHIKKTLQVARSTANSLLSTAIDHLAELYEIIP
ncbi:MAG: sigma factor-like helix-turn-helix DNA-binding protein [Oscillospiraceae bacterium]